MAALAGTASAQSPVGTVANIPTPDGNAYSTALRYDAGGDLYAWDGLSVWKQTGGTGTFNNLGSAGAGNSADAGPIAFSQGGESLLLSNGAGGFQFAGNGGFWTMPAAGGTAAPVPGSGIPWTAAAAPLPAASAIPSSGMKYLVLAGNDTWTGSSISVYDAVSDTSRLVIGNDPGATASIAFNPGNNRLYVGVGFGSYAGKVYSFGIGQIDAAYRSGIPLDFLSQGLILDPTAQGSQSGAGMFFDGNGSLLSGGGGITAFRPDGTIGYDQTAGADYYDILTYNPANNQVLKVPYGSSAGSLYKAVSFDSVGPGVWTLTSGTIGSWASGQYWSLGQVPGGSTATVSFSGTSAASATVNLDGNRSAEVLVFDVTGSTAYTLARGSGGTLTLGAPAGAWITAYSGTQTISAPVALASSLSVGVATGAVVNLCGGVEQAAGTSAALSLSGGGELVLGGTNEFTGGAAVAAGTLLIASAGALPPGESLIIGAPLSGLPADYPGLAAESAALVPNALPLPASAGTSAVPEPSTAAIAGAAVLFFLIGGAFHLVARK